MRLKAGDGPLQVINQNRNNDILNSPKRINTVQNSNFNNTQGLYHASTKEITKATQQLTIEDVAALNNVHIDTQELRWSDLTSHAQTEQQDNHRQLTLTGLNNRLNINSNLAVRLRLQAQNTAHHEDSSPQSDDDEASFASTTQEESADSAESSDEGNEYIGPPLKGFVNPNYPGFQHLAHTLDFDEDSNNNIDSVNRLDSVENIQKVFLDKAIELEDQSPVDTTSSSSSSSSESGVLEEDDKIDVTYIKNQQELLINQDSSSVLGNLVQEVEQELQQLQQDTVQTAKSSVQPNTQNSLKVSQPEILQDSKTIKSEKSLQQRKAETLAKIGKSISSRLKNKETQLAQNVSYMDVEISQIKPTFLPISPVGVVSEQTRSPIENKLVDASLSTCGEDINTIAMPKSKKMVYESRELENIEIQIKKIKSDTINSMVLKKEDLTIEMKEKDDAKVNTLVKKRKDYNQQVGSLITFPKRDTMNRRSFPASNPRKKLNSDFEGFDVYNIETAMPKIDLEAIENHLKAAKEEERRRRTDREEIRRRLAMGNEDDYYTDRPGRKPSLQARLQSGMNLQICFMNETVSDNESPSSDNECPLTNPKPAKTSRQNINHSDIPQPAQRPATLSLHPLPPPPLGAATAEADFFTKQARLQTEARMALAQAKEMARMQMEIERQRQKKSPITEMVRHSLEKVGIPFPEEKRRLSRQILTEMNVAQLQVIVNDLHTQIETLNEQLVKFLMNRDDLHMEQDSMLVDIEDLTRYLGAKEQVLKDQTSTPQNNNLLPPPSPAPSSPLISLNNSVRPHLNRIASLVKK